MLFGQSMPYGAPAAFGPDVAADPSLLVLAGYNFYILGIVILIALFLLVSVVPFFAVLFGCEIALKILPEEFSRDPERVARFQREAELLFTQSPEYCRHLRS